MSARSTACDILEQVIIKKRSLSTELNPRLNQLKEQDKPLCHEIVFGVLRYYYDLQATVNQYLKKKIPNKNKKLEIILVSACYQLIFLKQAHYAVINDSVNLASSNNFQFAKGLVNAVLRKISTNPDLITTDCHNFPSFLQQSLKDAYPKYYLDIYHSSLQPPVTFLRPHNIHPDDYLSLLEKVNIKASRHLDAQDALVLKSSHPVTKLPYFEEGKICIQDANAQLAANLLDVKDNQTILDACAAPGGKTAHIASKANNLNIIAVDESEKRLARMQENLTRLKVDATLIKSPIQAIETWHQDQVFDRILLDAPCSATGVIRHHPDILHLRQEDDIKNLQNIQRQMLHSCWKRLKVNGILIYATCSLLPDENQHNIRWFLKKHDNVKLDLLSHPRSVSATHTLKGTLQFLPTNEGDGFFYAKLIKTS